MDGKTYSEAKELAKQLDDKILKLRKEYQESMDILMETVEAIKSKAEKLSESKDLVEKAHKRRILGKLPYPTKATDGLGDGIAWEMLLAIGDSEKTIIVTEDWGWKNVKDGNPNALHPFMRKEWRNITRGEIKLYNSLSDFLKTELPQVKLSKKDIDLDKKASQVNPSTYPVTYPVTYGGTPTGWDGSMILGGRVVLAPGKAQPPSPFGDREIICVNCQYPFEHSAIITMGAAQSVTNCPKCGAMNAI